MFKSNFQVDLLRFTTWEEAFNCDLIQSFSIYEVLRPNWFYEEVDEM